ncbi:hypothetical protein BOTBODRAFT_182017 [Botryobasidium botryosum FD-172 SS1]|uniref:Uncharacterized protein n=1 Tax=Botryobasidium botryosum (strain FD-172 SS1) TaxID=930990 RepID=A0A067M292_BOTB1|nr:hypothetical protein BOTBODRAFT_182017 [Botryobasidium botryosum FD-172 SS1]
MLFEALPAILRILEATWVSATGMWPVVGAKLGYGSFPGEGGQPPRSSPQVAERLSMTYTRLLVCLEVTYIAILRRQSAGPGQQGAQQLVPHPSEAEGSVGASSSGHPSGLTQAQLAQAQAQLVQQSKLSIAQMIQLVPLTIEQLQTQVGMSPERAQQFYTEQHPALINMLQAGIRRS